MIDCKIIRVVKFAIFVAYHQCYVLVGVMRWRKASVYNVLHKTSVSLLMAFSVVLTGYIGFGTVHLFKGMYSATLQNVINSKLLLVIK